jgi:hypothetical protein
LLLRRTHSALSGDVAEAADVNRDCHFSGGREFAQARAKIPSGVFIESRELEFSLLRGNRRQITFADHHEDLAFRCGS